MSAAGLHPDARPTPDDVAAAYRWILGRLPESEQVVRAQVAAVETSEDLRRRLLASAEFRVVGGFAGSPALPVGPAPAIELDAPPEAVARLLVLQQRLWQRLGETAPHWSALPQLIYRPEHVGDSRRSLYASGREERELLMAVLGRLGLDPARFRHLVDFGCGVGRATLHLAALCPEVTGVDFAPAQLAVARQEALARAMDHIAWLAVRGGATMPAGGCDLWFSRRTLHHNPPPVIRALLRRSFAELRPGGLAVFQLLTFGDGYGFVVADALAAGAPQRAEHHALPQPEVFALAAAAGLEVLAVHDDPVPGLDRTRWLSHLFVLRRPG